MAEMVEIKPYTFRTLSSVDVFPMFRIISKIGINEFTACFESDTLKQVIKMFTEKTGDDDKQTTNDDILTMAGISVTLEIANVVLGNLPKCENDIYHLLSQTSNLSVDDIKGLPMATFAEMVIDFIKKDEFSDFIKVVSKLFK